MNRLIATTLMMKSGKVVCFELSSAKTEVEFGNLT